MEPFFVPEPNLFFRDGKECVDPKVGLLNFGPNGLEEPNELIRIGIVGSNKSVSDAKDFFTRLKFDIAGKEYENSNVRSIDFPGVGPNQPLGFYFEIVDEFCQNMDEDLLKFLKSDAKRKEKIIRTAEAFKQVIEDIAALHPGPDVLVVSYPEEVLRHCRTSRKSKEIRLYKRNFSSLKFLSRLDKNERPPFYDLHNFIKVIGFQNNIKTQIIYPNTLRFSAGQDPATIAWNLVSAMFYKSTGHPWKLSDLEKDAVHVGISFYNDLSDEQEVIVRAAIAQVYMRSGDSQIIRGVEIPIADGEDRTVSLDSSQAHQILTESINLYKRSHSDQIPHRVVVHKSSDYTQQEINGFDEASKDISITDYLHIKQNTKHRYLTSSKYPIARGTAFSYKDTYRNELVLYTMGYVSALDTYPGSGVPFPLEVNIIKGESNHDKLAYDLMNLTKLDWNTTTFSRSDPVTISTSRKVAAIMAEITLIDKDINLPVTYADYM